MRMKAWLKSHMAIAVVGGLLLAWIVYRVVRGLSLTSAGHASPEDAITYGWSVYQAGITGWKEVSPDGKIVVDHDSGWNGDPFAKV
jgi:hypothetical protein